MLDKNILNNNNNNNNNDTLIKRLTSKRPLGALQNVNYKYKKCGKVQ